MDDIEKCIQDLRLATASLDPASPSPRNEKLNDIESDLAFLRIGNGIHNIHYASTLTRTLVEELSALCDELNIARPQIDLPSADDFPREAGREPTTDFAH